MCCTHIHRVAVNLNMCRTFQSQKYFWLCLFHIFTSNTFIYILPFYHCQTTEAICAHQIVRGAKYTLGSQLDLGLDLD